MEGTSPTARFPLLNVDTPPLPIAVEVGGRDVLITFDKDLVDQPLDPANWVLNLDPSGTQTADSAAVIVPNQVTLGFSTAFVALSIEYFATPPDVEGTPPNGLDVAPFVFPLV